MRALILVAVVMLSSCGGKAKEPERRKMTVTETTVEVHDYTRFAANSAEIAADQTGVLDAIVSTLEATPEITKVEIQGHANASELDPLGISEARAEAVAAYLRSKGIDPARLVAKGYGTDSPLPADDPAAEGTENRAVGYMILERSDQ